MFDNGLGERALRPARAGQEAAELAVFDHKVPPAQITDLVGLLYGDLDTGPLEGLLGLLHLLVEALVEVAQNGLIGQLAGLHLVKAVFHAGGELHVDDVVEAVLHKLRDHLAQGGGLELFLLFEHVLPVLDGGDNGGIGGRTAHALFLHGLDQGGLGVAGGRLGKVLLLLGAGVQDLLALGQLGQRVEDLLGLVVAAFLVHRQKAGEFQALVVGAEDMALTLGVDGGGVIDGVGHLAGHKAAPDQLVQAVLVARQTGGNVVGVKPHVAGADGLVRVLGRALALEAAGRAGIVGRAVASGDEIPGGKERLVRQAKGVCTHIGDQTNCAVALYVHALIELLGDRHGALGRHVQFSGSLLLERRGDKRGRGRAALFRFFQTLHPEAAALHVADDLVHLRFGSKLALFAFAVIVALKAAGLADAVQPHVQGPILLGHEGADLILPVHDQASRHRLHPSGGQAAAYLPPQKRRELVAHNAVKDPSGLLGIHQILVDVPGLADGLGDHAAGDLVEGDPAGFLPAQAQKLPNVPGDGLALAVRVSGKVDRTGLVGGFFELADQLLLAGQGDIFRFKIMLQVHAHGALGQVPQMTHAGLDLKVRAEIFSNGFSLGRRLHDHKIRILLRHG